MAYESNSSSSSSSSSSNSPAYKNAKDALNSYKMEVAKEIGVNLKNGYNGDLTSYEAGTVGGEMVKRMIASQEQKMSGK